MLIEDGASPLYDPARLAKAMERAGLDLLLATEPANIQYLTGYRKPGRVLAAIARADPTRPTLVVPTGQMDFCLEDPIKGVEVIAYGRFYRHFDDQADSLMAAERLIWRLQADARTELDEWQVFQEIATSAGPDPVIGCDGAGAVILRVAEVIPGAETHDATSLFRTVRSVKTNEELLRLTRAAEHTETAIRASVATVSEGTTQRELARAFRVSVSQLDCSVRSESISIGSSAAFGDVNMRSDVVLRGSAIRYDVGLFHAGYASDVARCYAAGQPSDKARRYHAALVEGQRAALQAIRPGTLAKDVFEEAVAAVRGAGIPHYARTHVGHGIGIAGAGYDQPLLAPGDETPIEVGMVLCVETPYYELGFGGLQVEDMVVIEAGGFRLLTHLPRDLQLLG